MDLKKFGLKQTCNQDPTTKEHREKKSADPYINVLSDSVS